MTDITVTPANVTKGTGAKTVEGIAGEAITAGQALYLDATDSTYKLADADSATAAVRTVRGIALNGASTGQPVVVQREGEIDLGATLVVGGVYTLSPTAGGIHPHADLVSDDYVSVIGVALAADSLMLGILNSGVAKP